MNDVEGGIDIEALTRDAVREAAARTLPHASVVLFGSRARGDAGRRSDFDLAVVPAEGFSRSEWIAFAEALDASPRIIHPVDLVLWTEASPELRARIESEGVAWTN